MMHGSGLGLGSQALLQLLAWPAAAFLGSTSSVRGGIGALGVTMPKAAMHHDQQWPPAADARLGAFAFALLLDTGHPSNLTARKSQLCKLAHHVLNQVSAHEVVVCECQHLSAVVPFSNVVCECTTLQV
jgi:hypothetical protein